MSPSRLKVQDLYEICPFCEFLDMYSHKLTLNYLYLWIESKLLYFKIISHIYPE